MASPGSLVFGLVIANVAALTWLLEPYLGMSFLAALHWLLWQSYLDLTSLRSSLTLALASVPALSEPDL